MCDVGTMVPRLGEGRTASDRCRALSGPADGLFCEPLSLSEAGQSGVHEGFWGGRTSRRFVDREIPQEPFDALSYRIIFFIYLCRTLLEKDRCRQTSFIWARCERFYPSFLRLLNNRHLGWSVTPTPHLERLGPVTIPQKSSPDLRGTSPQEFRTAHSRIPIRTRSGPRRGAGPCCSARGRTPKSFVHRSCRPPGEEANPVNNGASRDRLPVQSWLRPCKDGYSGGFFDLSCEMEHAEWAGCTSRNRS